MAASVGQHSYTSTLGYGADSVTISTITNLTDLIDADADGFKIGETKITHIASPNGFHEYTPGFGDGGTLSCTINFDKTTYNTLTGFARAIKWWKLAAPDGGNLSCRGFITELPFKVPDDDRITGTVKIKLTGKPTFATS